MKEKSIVIIGDSPATYICAIYLFTANIKPVVIRKDLSLEYICTFAPGVEADKEEYNRKCYEQAKNMGIDIQDASDIEITKDGDRFKMSVDSKAMESDILVLDRNITGLKLDENLFIVSDLMLEKEAIVVAGTGCMIAFEIKDIMN